MHRKSSTQDLRDLLDTVAPKVESALHTVAEKAPPAIEHGRAAAVEHGSHLAEALADRLPDSVVDRLPERVVDHLPISRPRRGRKLLLVGLVAAVAGAAVAARQTRGSSAGEHRTAVPRPTPVEDPGGAVGATPSTATQAGADGLVDPSDPLVEPQFNGRRD